MANAAVWLETTGRMVLEVHKDEYERMQHVEYIWRPLQCFVQK